MSESSQQLSETTDESVNSDPSAVSSEDRPQEEKSLVSQKTQGVRPAQDNGIGVLHTAAKKAAASNSRSDVHEYMRLRRRYV